MFSNMADGNTKKKLKTAAELDAELDEYLDKLMAKKKTKYKDGFTEENWEEEMEKMPIFTTKPIQDGDEVSPEIAAMQALRYEDENPTARAEAYKEEGNYEYKNKNFRKAIIAYTEGIMAKSEDKNLNAILYTNRATVNFTLGNNRSALKDALQARKFDPNYMKAIVRGSHAAFKIKLYDHAIRWCDEGLKIDPDHAQLQDLRKDAVNDKKKDERDKRKAKQVRKRMYEERIAIVEEIKKRNIRCEKTTQQTVEDEDDDDDIDEDERKLKEKFNEFDLGPYHPSGATVQLDENQKLYWPVLFFYPEYQQSDFIAAFCEENCFMDHFQVMFGGNDAAPWDDDCKYEPDKLECYFEDQERGCLVRIQPSATLKEVLSDKRYVVRHGTPGFVIVVKNSPFREEFLNKYCKTSE